jgi:GNAT superfamily N-acetyltransferase
MPETPAFTIRAIEATDIDFLKTAMYHAIFIPPGSPPCPEEIVDTPEIARYWHGWGRAGDIGVMAVQTSTRAPIGAAWLRVWDGTDRGYGFVSPEIPEMSVSVVPGMRGRGIGTELIGALLFRADARFTAVSLSIDPDNPAISLYTRFGFVRLDRDEDSIILLRRPR